MTLSPPEDELPPEELELPELLEVEPLELLVEPLELPELLDVDPDELPELEEPLQVPSFFQGPHSPEVLGLSPWVQ